MSLRISTSLVAQTFALDHEASSLVLYNGHAGLGSDLMGPLPDARVDGRSLDSRKNVAEGCLPEVDDEVLVAFEHGEPRRPFVIAPLWDSKSEPPQTPGASHLDSMSEMGETESLRLQMAMDRLSKMMSTLSNALRKIEETQAAITQNIK